MYSDGNSNFGYGEAYDYHNNILPTLYLRADIGINAENGDGSYDTPYQLSVN